MDVLKYIKLHGLTLEYIPEDDLWFVSKEDKTLGIGESPEDAVTAAMIWRARKRLLDRSTTVLKIR